MKTRTVASVILNDYEKKQQRISAQKTRYFVSISIRMSRLRHNFKLKPRAPFEQERQRPQRV